MTTPVAVGFNAVVAAVTDEVPRVLIVGGGEADRAGAALPFGALDAEADLTLERGLRRCVQEQAGLELGYVEQLYTFGDKYRTGEATSPRALAVAYLALVKEGAVSGSAGARWQAVYQFLPWEDWRGGRPTVLAREIEPRVEQWVLAAPPPRQAERRERAGIAFGLAGTPWDGERVLERYELLYELGLVEEAARDRGEEVSLPERPGLGRPLVADHRRILATALGRLRGKLRYRPVVFELLPPTFTLLQLQRTVEALAGVQLHKGNFRRLVEAAGLVEGTGQLQSATGGRPAEIFRFRREVLRERPAPGVGLPGVRG